MVKVVENVLWPSSVDFDEYIIVTVLGGVKGAWLDGEGGKENTLNLDTLT